MTIYEIFSRYNEVYKINNLRFDQPADAASIITEEEKAIYSLIMNIISLHEDYRNPDKLFGPQMRWEGKRTFDVYDLTEYDPRMQN